MKLFLSILLFSFFQYTSAQSVNEIQIFNRLIFQNSNNEILVVKIKNTDFWVTPGLYQNSEQTMRQGLDSIAMTYGIKIKELKLNGIFTLNRELNNKKSTSIRNIFTATYPGGKLKTPEIIEKTKWVEIDEALTIISFPHINLMLDKVMKEDNKVWGGSLLQFRDNGSWKSKITEEFYELSVICK
ncbi:NUDIX hydrolase [Spongiivirga citrea]|uniref:NUDIX hydrolase n=1 Tax=Spongiivirga citrea TaxID=1481457 RepID=A0A6M0CFM1_9FLAO|nr:hypothetical protein [Spongiivirga citrea]NER16601.1 hypothetical protein [Spongiivirga citrea]